MDIFLYVTVFAAVSASMLISLIKPYAGTLGLVDIPGGHKSHQHVTPLVGGIGFYLAALVSTQLFQQLLGEAVNMMPLYVGFLLVLVGALDDRHNLGVRSRFAVQIVVGLMMTMLGGAVLQDIGQLFMPHTLGLGGLAIPLTIFALVGGINAMNMSDGLDGLAGSLALVSLSALAVVAAMAGHDDSLLLIGALVGGTIGFLAFNLRLFGRTHAAVFMGDAGSMLLGMAITWLLIQFSQGESRAMTPVTALWLFAVPLMDTVGIMVRRMLKKRSPFTPDNGHFHHILQRAGYSVNETVAIIVAVHGSMAMMGLGGLYLGVPEYIMFYLFMAIFTAYFWLTMHAWRFMKRLRAFHENAYNEGGANS